MELQLDGLVGVVIFLGTIALVAIITLITLLASIYQSRFGGSSRRIGEQGVFNYFLASAIILAIDVFFFALIISTPKVMSKSEAVSLDWWMLYVWGPVHIFVFIISVVILKRFRNSEDLSKST